MNHVTSFIEKAQGRLPGVVYGFNIADFKRRNMHYGHVLGDGDVAELDCLLWQLGTDVTIARTHGDRWLVLAPEGSGPRIEQAIACFSSSESFNTGWKVSATKDGETRDTRSVVPSIIRRAVRCLFAPVKTRADLESAVKTIVEEDYSLPVDRLVALDEIPSLERKPWWCVSAYPQSPTCPFCDGKEVDWIDGDGSMYTGDGTCRGCGAKLAIRDVDDLGSEKSGSGRLADLGYRVAAEDSRSRVVIAEERGRRLLVSILRAAIEPRHEVLRGRPPWDLPLLRVRPVYEVDEPVPSVLVELLPRGVRSTRSRARESRSVPPFVLAIATQFAEAHAKGQVVGELHPSLVFVDDETGALVACSQRPLRAERHLVATKPGSACGEPPMFGIDYLSPRTIRGEKEDDATDDVFRLAAMIWRWRHGESPFGERNVDCLQRMIEGTTMRAPQDDFDRMLVRAFAVDPQKRPRAAEIVETLRALGNAWQLSSNAMDHPRLATTRARVNQMLAFLEERVEAKACAKAALYVETTIEVDAASEDVTHDAYIFAVKQDGRGDAYRFSGDPDALVSSFKRRIAAGYEKPGSQEIDRLASEVRAPPGGPVELPPFEDARAFLMPLAQDLETRVKASPRKDALRTKSNVTLRLRYRLFAEVHAKTRIERIDVELAASVEHRLSTTAPRRLHGEEQTESDFETSAGARQTFRHVPTAAELDALVKEARAAKPWL